MHVFDFVVSGAFLDYEDEAWSSGVRYQLTILEGAFFEANDALNLFLSSLSEASKEDEKCFGLDQAVFERRSVIEEKMGGGVFSLSYSDYLERRVEVEAVWKREKWSTGASPRNFIWNRPLVYARMFVFALDTFECLLKVLQEDPKVPQQVSVAFEDMRRKFPNLRGIRNSAHHLEDRARGIATYKRKIDLKPMQSGGINAPGGALVLSALHGTVYGYTMENGFYGEIDVSPQTMLVLKSILDVVLSSFAWKGPKEHRLSY